MEKSLKMLLVLFLFSFFRAGSLIAEAAAGTIDESERWGYVEVRPKAHMFWLYYKSPNRITDSSKPWPIILWLQGGPGSSGVGLGNFEEIGPLDRYLKPRNSTWLKKADLLFVDAPVGTGYSYVEDINLLSKTDVEAASDLTTLLISFFNESDSSLRKSPLYILAESYGGKIAVALGLSALNAIHNGKLKAQLGGIALGNAWISPEDYTSSWGPLLKAVSRLDNNGLRESNRFANQISKQLKDGMFVKATGSWEDLEDVIGQCSNDVNFYNFLTDSKLDPISSSTATSMKQYSNYLTSLNSLPKTVGKQDGNLTRLMNDEIKKKLKIIPKNLIWEQGSSPVSNAFVKDFMIPRIDDVDQLLSKGVNITIYNGQLDLICSTMGTEAWLEKLKWDGIGTFLSKNRTPIYCGEDYETKGFVKSHKNLKFYWILGAGHFVPVEQPCAGVNMIADITSSPAAF